MYKIANLDAKLYIMHKNRQYKLLSCTAVGWANLALYWYLVEWV